MLPGGYLQDLLAGMELVQGLLLQVFLQLVLVVKKVVSVMMESLVLKMIDVII